MGGFIAVIGGVIVALLADWLVRKRERKEGIVNRRRAFLAFMESWKHEIGRLHMCDGGAGFEHRHSSFSNVVSSFMYEAGLIKRDFDDVQRNKFEALCSAVVGGKHTSIYTQEDNDKMKKAMDELIVFVEKTGL